jgi:hypothetical protein
MLIASMIIIKIATMVTTRNVKKDLLLKCIAKMLHGELE